jgi:hypothetical protein
LTKSYSDGLRKSSDGDEEYESDIGSGESSDSYDRDDRWCVASTDDDDREEKVQLMSEIVRRLDTAEEMNSDDECYVPEISAEFEEISLSRVDKRV